MSSLGLYATPAQPWTLANLSERDAGGVPRLFRVVARGLLDQVPKALWPDLMKIESDHGDRVVHVAASYGGLKSIPAELITEAHVRHANLTGITALQLAACTARLDELPPRVITREGLMEPGAHRGTAFHGACGQGRKLPNGKYLAGISQIPPEMITEEALLLANLSGTTPAFLAAIYDRFQFIPDAAKTERVFRTIEPEGGKTILEIALRNGGAGIPRQFRPTVEPDEVQSQPDGRAEPKVKAASKPTPAEKKTEPQPVTPAAPADEGFLPGF